ALQSKVFVPAFDERPHFAIDYRPLQHPEAAVRMRPDDAAFAEHALSNLEAARDSVGSFDVIHLHVDDTDTEGNARIDLAQRLEVDRRAVRDFEHEMLRVELREKTSERFPVAALDRLTA